MYRVMTRSLTESYVQGRQDESVGAGDETFEQRGREGEDWIDDVEDTLERVLAVWREARSGYRSDQARDELEGRLSVVLHEGLVDLPSHVLTDKGFWRYCAVRLYDFVIWRQPSEKVRQLLPYFGAKGESIGRDCVPHRMFDRGHIVKTGGDMVGDPDPYALATFGAADVWKSHILRVANGNAPLVVRAMLTEVKDGKLRTDVVRPFAKDLRRVRSNVLFEVLDEDQARLLVLREEERALAESTTNHSVVVSD